MNVTSIVPNCLRLGKALKGEFCFLIGHQESTNHEKCELMNTCTARTTDDLTNEGSTTLNINDKAPTSGNQATLTASDDLAKLTKPLKFHYAPKKNHLLNQHPGLASY